jgi:hypothetical protein
MTKIDKFLAYFKPLFLSKQVGILFLNFDFDDNLIRFQLNVLRMIFLVFFVKSLRKSQFLTLTRYRKFNDVNDYGF